jgi:hypothetical protein
MKVRFEMELEDVLRIAVLLDLRRIDYSRDASAEESGPLKSTHVKQTMEAEELRAKLLKAAMRK